MKKWDYSSWDCPGFTPDSLLIHTDVGMEPLRHHKGMHLFHIEGMLYGGKCFVSLAHLK